MAEVRREVRAYQVAMNCNACGKDGMFPTGVVLTSYPAQYPHRCRACGAVENFRTQYPHIDYEPVASGVQEVGRG